MKIVFTAKIAGTTVGHIDHALAYACGLRRLGHEVTLMEQVGSGRCRDADGHKVPFVAWNGRRHFEQVARAYGLWPRCCLIYKQGEASHGMDFADAVRTAETCDLLIARSGQIEKVPAIFEKPPRRAFVDGNPGTTQVAARQGDADFAALGAYEHLFTMGLNVGDPGCPIPTDGRAWNPILRPVVLPMWPPRFDDRTERFTTISTWSGRHTFDLDGRASGEKSDNWLTVLELPGRTGGAFEIALRLDGDDRDAIGALFRERGWRLADPAALRRFEDYRNYIGGSRAEFSVAHNRYVAFHSGWFSDRSALYLASGKPVLVQSTGIERHLPTGKGLLTFTTLDEAVAGVEAINRDYGAHCRAARRLAEQYFDADRVLCRFLERIGV